MIGHSIIGFRCSGLQEAHSMVQLERMRETQLSQEVRRSQAVVTLSKLLSRKKWDRDKSGESTCLVLVKPWVQSLTPSVVAHTCNNGAKRSR